MLASTRRDFLRCSLAFLAAPAIVRASSLMPVRAYLPILYGDGIHNDTEAIQALLDGKPFRRLKTLMAETGPRYMRGGNYLIDETLFITSANERVTLTNVNFDFRDTRAAPVFLFLEGSMRGQTEVPLKGRFVGYGGSYPDPA